MTDGLLDRKIEYRLTWAAIIVAIILMVPGFIIGSIVASIYGWVLESFLRIGGDRWIFFLEWIGYAVLIWFPALMSGMIGGLFSIVITGMIFKSASMRVVSYVASAIYISMVMITMFSSYFNDIYDNFDIVSVEDLVSVAAQTIGIVLGLCYFRIFGH